MPKTPKIAPRLNGTPEIRYVRAQIFPAWRGGWVSKLRAAQENHVAVLCPEVAAYWKVGVCLNEHGDRTLRTEFWPALTL